MQRDHGTMVCTGTRDELIADLEDSAVGWAHFAKDELANACATAAERLRAGELEVMAGHTTYRVIMA